MFKKPFHIKSKSSLKQSEKKRLRGRILQSLHFTEDDFNQLLVDTLPLSKSNSDEPVSFRHVDIEQSKIICFNDEPCTVYYFGGEPLFFEEGEAIVPTVYTLWVAPKILPTLTINNFVLAHLHNGADLMLPGVVDPLEELPLFSEGDIVSVTTHETGVPLGIGKALLSNNQIVEKKGKVLKMLHVMGDHLWESGSRKEPPLAITEDVLLVKPESENEQTNVSGDEELQKEISVTPEEMDHLFQTTLLNAIVKMDIKDSQEMFPFASSTFYTKFMIPHRPRGSQLDIHKSTFKKFSKFLKAMEKLGYLKLKEMKGDTIVMSVSSTHQDVINFDPLPEEKQNHEDIKKPLKKDKIKIETLFKTNDAFQLLLNDIGISSDGYLTKSEIHKFVMDYSIKHNLLRGQRKKIIEINLVFKSFLKKNEREGILVLPPDELKERVLEQLRPFIEITIPGKEPVISKGSLDCFEVKTKKVSGNKDTTIIKGNFSRFGIQVEQIAKELQGLCACSVSVQEESNRHHQILIQGYRTKEAIKLLEEKYGVPKSYIQNIPPKNGKKK